MNTILGDTHQVSHAGFKITDENINCIILITRHEVGCRAAENDHLAIGAQSAFLDVAGGICRCRNHEWTWNGYQADAVAVCRRDCKHIVKQLAVVRNQVGGKRGEPSNLTIGAKRWKKDVPVGSALGISL